jgi:hypothetical protein
MIQTILDNHKLILIENDWPTDAKFFFNKICRTDVDHRVNKKLYHLIAKLFNSWCLWCEPRPVSKNDESKMLSVNPYDPDGIVNCG